MLSFEDLTEARRYLQSFCLLHLPSLLKVQSGISFKLLPGDPELDEDTARHLTTSATCYVSLFDLPPPFPTIEIDRLRKLGSTFAERALERDNEKWTSEGSAGVYCRCRALPMVIYSLNRYDERIEAHLREILGQLDSRPERFGIGEAGTALPEEQWYPPNAFHTYWTLEILDLIKNKYQAEYSRFSEQEILDLKRRREGMLVWGKQQLGIQLGLHSASPASSMLDSDQLAWSIAIFLRFDQTLSVNLENRDFIKQAFKCLFSTQTDGTWRHYKPLFHYKKAGNAYCYVFETFAALLQCALRRGAEAEMIRELLKPYGKNLMELWRYADQTKIPLPSSNKEIGWCSGHRTNVTEPESWATASVFSYAQALRRLVGIWCREEAHNSLKTPRRQLSPEKAAERMISRGKSWGAKAPVSEQLWTAFVNPVRMHECNDRLEPDSQPIEANHARSAILFGPPGTSKTTLVRSLADVIKWDYIELHASHFVAEGLTQVQKTADRIFRQLSELDHIVVLFDEIDELVREREMEEDAFGRFLTTSMLPKLAELWEARKLLYFVATNHINYFDSAIIRSHRFDALMLVSPPSFTAKVEELTRLLSATYGFKGIHFDVTERTIQKELNKVVKESSRSNKERTKQAASNSGQAEQKLRSEFALAKFALLRWDELNELAYQLAGLLRSYSPSPRTISAQTLRNGLIKIADSQWRKNKSYSDYFRDTQSQRRDYQMLNVWEIKGDADFAKLSGFGVVCRNGVYWLPKAVDSLDEIKIPGFDLISKSPGCIEIRASAPTAQKDLNSPNTKKHQ
jgi:hypothetical protein